jgi:hypothetical protein
MVVREWRVPQGSIGGVLGDTGAKSVDFHFFLGKIKFLLIFNFLLWMVPQVVVRQRMAVVSALGALLVLW